MSLNKSAARRLSLLAGSSIVAVGLTALAPTAALAANECGDPNDNAAVADTFACTGSQAGITYGSTNGTLTLTLTNGVAVTTSGVSVTTANADAVTINRSDAPTAGAGDPSITSAAGAGIAVTTGTGAITVNLTDGDVGDTPIAVTGATRGVRLETSTTTAAALTLTTTNGAITATGGSGIGVEAISNSIGAGNVALNLGGAVSGAIGVKGTSSGTGTLTVTLTAASATVSGGDVVGTNGPAIQLTPGGNATVTVNAGRTVRAANPGGAVIEFTTVNAGRTVTVTNQGANAGHGTIRPEDDGPDGYGQIAILVGGGAGGATVTNSRAVGANSQVGLIQGRIAMLNTGAATVTNRGEWHTTGVNTFGAGSGAGTLTNSAVNDALPAILGTNFGGAATSLVFGDGADVFNNNGIVALGEGDEGAATLTITGLETWNNAGSILFGTNATYDDSDGVANDRIVATGAAFTGSSFSNVTAENFSRLVMDADFGANQADCSAAVNADCLDLRGGSTAGTTPVVVNVVGVGAADRLVLVDVSGAGASAAGHFTLSPDSPGYMDVGGTGGVVDGGMFLYDLTYDADTKQHVLAAASPATQGLELNLVERTARVAWDTTTGAWFTRQADLRNTVTELDTGMGVGGWLKIAGNFVDHLLFQTYAFGPDTTEFETSYDQRTSALVGGVDLVSVIGQDSAWVIGVTGGYVESDLDFKTSLTTAEYKGHSLGAYASFTGASFFVDAIVNAVNQDVTYQAPGAALADVEGDVESLGYQVEGGYRIPVFDRPAYLEPLVLVSYVRSKFSDFDFGVSGAQFDDATSFRGALGLRVGGDLVTDAFTSKFSFTGRLWEEFEGENTAVLVTPTGGFALLDDTAETLGDLGVALGLFSAGARFSANLAYGVKFNSDNYQSTDASLGFRYTW